MSFRAFESYNEWNRSDTLLKSIKKAERTAYKRNAEKKHEEILISYQSNISKMSLAFFVYLLLPQLYDRLSYAFSDSKCLDNVISSSFVSRILWFHLQPFWFSFLSCIQKTTKKFQLSFDVLFECLALTLSQARMTRCLSARSIWRSFNHRLMAFCCGCEREKPHGFHLSS